MKSTFDEDVKTHLEFTILVKENWRKFSKKLKLHFIETPFISNTEIPIVYFPTTGWSGTRIRYEVFKIGEGATYNPIIGEGATYFGTVWNQQYEWIP